VSPSSTSIRELIPDESERVTTTAEREQIEWHGELIPLIRLEKILNFSRPHPNSNLTGYPAIDRSTMVVVGNKPNFFAIQISRFWGEQEATIRQIQSPLPLPPGFTSAMIFGDGRVIPLLDYLPLATAYFDRSRSTPNLPINLQLSSSRTQLQTILVVDDSITVRRLLSSTLERTGYRVEQAKDGQEAVEKLLDGLQVAALICDVEMPRLDGYGLLEELRSRAEFQNLPIAMLTSRSNDKHRKLAMNLGASAYFSKPYNEQELLEKLAELLQHD
jgi:two-component system, chemotaxis family, sensor histidine kinase and response regulator PixL